MFTPGPTFLEVSIYKDPSKVKGQCVFPAALMHVQILHLRERLTHDHALFVPSVVPSDPHTNTTILQKQLS